MNKLKPYLRRDYTLNIMAMAEEVEKVSEPLPDLLLRNMKDGSVEGVH